MIVTGVIMGGVFAGVATVAQHLIIKRQQIEIEELKNPKDKTNEEQPHDANDFAYLIQGKQPKNILQKELDQLVKGDGA